jgi:hypothetical protein
MIIAGWADGYRNNSFRMIERLRNQGVPHHLLAGPWAHASTSNSLPGPRIDSMPIMAAWWDRWLRGEERSADTALDLDPDGPHTTIFVRSSTRPRPDLDTHNGFWIREEWPSPRVSERELSLVGRDPYTVDPAVGVDAWIDCAGHLPWGQSGDQRHDDASSLTWDFDGGQITLLGQPTVRLHLSVDAPVAYVSVKLCDVFADGTSALVTRGSLNLTHRDGHREPVALTPGQTYDLEVELDACAYQFDAGQRLRLSIAGADWPNTGAPPEPVTLTISGGTLELPVWEGPSPYDPPELVDSDEEIETAEGVTWAIERDVLTRETRCTVDHGSTYDIPNGGSATEHYRGTVTVDRRTFAQSAQAMAMHAITWPEASVAARATLDLATDSEAYHVSITLEATEGDEVVGRREWRETFPRDLG